VSRWLTGERYPSAQALIAIDRFYGISPCELDDDPVTFAQRLADPERIKYAEAIRAQPAKGEVTIADAAKLRAKMRTDAEAARRRVTNIAEKRRVKK
jgi:hypothetical protein